eukprot:m.25509 g.25509  ORF g.25509 m.25509 type:complete len:378 (-) comp11608_c0_seq1:38-1171(-)
MTSSSTAAALTASTDEFPARMLLFDFTGDVLRCAGFDDVQLYESTDEYISPAQIADRSRIRLSHHCPVLTLTADKPTTQEDGKAHETHPNNGENGEKINPSEMDTADDTGDEQLNTEQLDFRIDRLQDTTSLHALLTASECFIQDLVGQGKRLAANAARSMLTERDVWDAYQALGLSSTELQLYAEQYSQLESSGQPQMLHSQVPDVDIRKLPVPQTLPKVLKDESLRVERPPYMPTHLPDYPDPHTFVRTATYEPTETSYVSYRQRKAQQQYDARNALVHVVAKPNQDDLPLQANPIYKLPPLNVIVQPHKVRSQYAHLTIQPDLELPEPEVDDSDLSLNRVLKFENDMDAQAAHEARLEVKVEMIDEDYQPKNRS